MQFNVLQLDKEHWIDFSENAHKIAFNEDRPSDLDRIDYALLVVNEHDAPVAYMTCRELDAKSVYWQFGGALPAVKNTIYTLQSYLAMRDWHSKRYDRAVTYVENTNLVMIKMAMKAGFLITGVKVFHGSILLEHSMEFKNAK